jgi:hypothetical protein
MLTRSSRTAQRAPDDVGQCAHRGRDGDEIEPTELLRRSSSSSSPGTTPRPACREQRAPPFAIRSNWPRSGRTRPESPRWSRSLPYDVGPHATFRCRRRAGRARRCHDPAGAQVIINLVPPTATPLTTRTPKLDVGRPTCAISPSGTGSTCLGAPLARGRRTALLRHCFSGPRAASCHST